MRKALLLFTTVVFAVTAVACGKSPEQKQAEQTQKAADQMQKSAEGFAKGLEGMAKGLGAAGTDASGKPVQPVSFQDLEALLPDLPGWERGKPSGERMTSPVTYSSAKVTFTKGDASIDQTVTDSAMNQMIVAPISMLLSMGLNQETDDGYERAVKVGGFPGYEKWSKSDKSGEVDAIVNKRFMVQIEGHGIDDPKVLHDLMGRMDLAKLAALK